MTRDGFQLPPQGGVLLVDKVEGWTSHDVVARARRALGTRKVGHAGTLDPMATGLLVLGAGPSTRLLTHLVGLDKVYRATIRLGQSTITDDREGEIVTKAGTAQLDTILAEPKRISRAVFDLTGDIEQAPSAVSAIKVDGRRSYDRVRSGEDVELARRPVTIHRFEVGEPRRVELAGGVAVDIDATVQCSTGTYVRALARDLGEALGVGGHLTVLRRTEVGPFTVDGALKHARLIDGDVPASSERGPFFAPATVAQRLFPVIGLTAAQAVDLGHGKRVDLDDGQDPVQDDGCTRPVAAIGPDQRLVGLVTVLDGRLKTIMNFPTPDSQKASGGAA